mmetsp:Transcript_96612/g.249794  ORF Transcript_96612/g.249794 Transcript_96612/m.249794 type:complete len:238 (+) Transcript_96612:222-935(+)
MVGTSPCSNPYALSHDHAEANQCEERSGNRSSLERRIGNSLLDCGRGDRARGPAFEPVKGHGARPSASEQHTGLARRRVCGVQEYHTLRVDLSQLPARVGETDVLGLRDRGQVSHEHESGIAGGDVSDVVDKGDALLLGRSDGHHSATCLANHDCLRACAILGGAVVDSLAQGAGAWIAIAAVSATVRVRVIHVIDRLLEARIRSVEDATNGRELLILDRVEGPGVVLSHLGLEVRA